MKLQASLFDYPALKTQYDVQCGDALEVLKEYEDDKFDLIITSPPYNIGKSYELKTSIEDYLAAQETIIVELIRVLSARGSICWQVGNYVNKGEVFPLDIFYHCCPINIHENTRAA